MPFYWLDIPRANGLLRTHGDRAGEKMDTLESKEKQEKTVESVGLSTSFGIHTLDLDYLSHWPS